jgi:hypothetical protein
VPSDHRKSRALFGAVENQGTNTYPKAAGFASLLVPSIIDAKFQARPKCKIPKQCTAFSDIQPQKSPTRFNEDPKKEYASFES